MMKWTKEQDEIFRFYYLSFSKKKAMEVMGLTEPQARQRAYTLGLSKVRRWTAREINILTEEYAKAEFSDDIRWNYLVKETGREKQAIQLKATKLKLTDIKRKSKRTRKIRHKKYKTDQERSIAASKRIKEWYRNNPHPKGMLGKNHTEKTKKHISLSSKKYNASLTQEQQTKINLKIMKTRQKNGNYNVGKKGNWKAGWRTIAGKRNYYRSIWEANYGRYLQWLKEKGQIREWEHEPEVFWFENIKRGTVSYLPDFKVTENNGDISYHEVKGWMCPRSKTKLNRVAKYYPNVKIVLIQKKEYMSIKSQMQNILTGWETDSRGR